MNYRLGSITNALSSRAVTVFLVLLFSSASAQSPAGYSEAQPSRVPGVASDSLTDGPHVFWEDDSSVVVFYLCGTERVSFRLTVTDTLSFDGACTDSSETYLLSRTHNVVPPATIEEPSRLLAVSDIHGEFDALRRFLMICGVIDSAGHWCWGDGHLVAVGDVLDRGLRVTECLWFLRRLEREAAAAGGAVHMLLGNHDVIALRGDLRYVHERYLDGIVRKFRISYDDLFGPDTELGRWLRSRNTMLRVGRTLFVHADVSPELVDRQLTLRAINDGVRQAIDLSGPRVAFGDLPKLLLSSWGPLWFRGFHYGIEGRYDRLADDEVVRVLAYFDVDQVVVGHSEGEQILTDYNGRVISIDVPVDETGHFEALMREGGRFLRITGDGNRTPLR